MERKRKTAFHVPLLKLFIFWDTLPSLHSLGGGVPLRISRSPSLPPSLPISLCNSYICRRHERGGARRDDGHTKTTKTDARYGTKACVTEWRGRLETPLIQASSFTSNPFESPCIARGKKIFTVMESAVCRIHIVCFVYSLFLLFALPPFLLLLLQSVRESAVAMLKGIARPYLRWKLGIFSPSLCSLFILSDIPRMRGRPGRG